MRIAQTTMEAALAGAAMSVGVVFALSSSGLIPINSAQIRTYMLSHPELVGEMSAALQKQQQAQKLSNQQTALRQIGDQALFDPRIAFTVGPANAKRTLVEFYDYNCPYCRASLPAMERFVAMHMQDTRISFIEFPIKGVNSTQAARLAMAARKQPDKFLKLHFALMGEEVLVDQPVLTAEAVKAGLDMEKLKKDSENPEIAKALNAGRELATKLGIDGTPTFIVNGVVHPGAVDDQTLDALIRNAAPQNPARPG
jgi:protein-disulfide isomerase